MFESFTFKESTYESVPEGSYYAEYIGNEEATSKFAEDGKAIAWKWRIMEGDLKGKMPSRVTGKNPTPGNGCGKIIVGLVGKTPTASESVSVKDCIGKRYLIQVARTKDGKGTRVETVTRLPDK